MEAQTENTWAGKKVCWMVGRKGLKKDRCLVELLDDLKEDLSDLYRAEAAGVCSFSFASDCQHEISSEKTPERTQLNSIVGKEKSEFEFGKQLKPSSIFISTQVTATKISNGTTGLNNFTVAGFLLLSISDISKKFLRWRKLEALCWRLSDAVPNKTNSSRA